MTNRRAITLGATLALLCVTTGAMIGWTGSLVAVEWERDAIEVRHDSLDAELRYHAARAVVAGWAWMELAEVKATGLTGDRVWVTTLEEGE